MSFLLVTCISFHRGNKSRIIAYEISIHLKIGCVMLLFKTVAPAIVTLHSRTVRTLGTLGSGFVSVQVLVSTAERKYIVLALELICAFKPLLKYI